MSTSTTGLPVAWSARSSFSCGAGRPMSVRSPPAKPGIRDRHLLALDVAGEAADEDDHVGRARRVERLLERLLGARQPPGQADLGVADGLEVLEAQVVRLAGLEVERARSSPARAATVVHSSMTALAVHDRAGSRRRP